MTCLCESNHCIFGIWETSVNPARLPLRPFRLVPFDRTVELTTGKLNRANKRLCSLKAIPDQEKTTRAPFSWLALYGYSVLHMPVDFRESMFRTRCIFHPLSLAGAPSEAFGEMSRCWRSGRGVFRYVYQPNNSSLQVYSFVILELRGRSRTLGLSWLTARRGLRRKCCTSMNLGSIERLVDLPDISETGIWRYIDRLALPWYEVFTCSESNFIFEKDGLLLDLFKKGDDYRRANHEQSIRLCGDKNKLYVSGVDDQRSTSE